MNESQSRARIGPATALCIAAVLAVAHFGTNQVDAQEQANAPAPCGPAGDLSAEINRNVAANSRCFELRMYTADPSRVGVGDFNGGIDELHQRFREEEVALFEKHGAEIIAVWQDLASPNTLIWMLAYRDRAHRDQVWADFAEDPEWVALRLKYFVPLERPNVYMMSATDYSKLK
ncbi:NIPSNAP family protein [Candidatus Rariloculus sp.]|uniref:NIPSNAP family protein n=1 Tax=Candidatus Rariloculus sp. TaxID=3101265 RepID=UPI003D0CA82B